MNIIVLGMDNTGKTTLCKELNQITGMKIINSCGPKHTKEEMEEFISKNLYKDAILERFCFFEEMVYGKILRHKSKFTFKDKIFKKIKEANPYIIYCKPSNEVIKNWQNRAQMEGVINKADKLIKKFDKVILRAQKQGLRVIKYDYTKENVFNVIFKI